MFAEEIETAERTAEIRVAAHAAGDGSSDITRTAATSDALESAARRAGRRKALAQASLFDLANEKVIEDLRAVDPDSLTPEEAKALLKKLREQAL